MAEGPRHAMIPIFRSEDVEQDEVYFVPGGMIRIDLETFRVLDTSMAAGIYVNTGNDRTDDQIRAMFHDFKKMYMEES